MLSTDLKDSEKGAKKKHAICYIIQFFLYIYVIYKQIIKQNNKFTDISKDANEVVIRRPRELWPQKCDFLWPLKPITPEVP